MGDSEDIGRSTVMASDAPRSRWTGRLRRLARSGRRWLPDARLVWICLVALAAYGLTFLGGSLGWASIVGLPATAVVVDLLLQRLRFDGLRFPDAAIATGLFVALILPPVVPIVGAVAVTIAAITTKHSLRFRGRPVLNPASVGVVLGTLLFGFAPAWWGAIDENLVIALGVVLLLWARRTWRGTVSFLGAYAVLAVVERILLTDLAGGTVAPKVLLLATIDPSVLFFGFFLVSEPRTAPADPRAQPLYGGTVAAGSALLPVFLPTLGVFAALFTGNLLSVGLRRRALAAEPGPLPTPYRRRGTKGTRSTERSGWGVPQRAGVALTVLLLVAFVAAATYNPLTTPAPILLTSPGTGGLAGGSGAGSGVSTSFCQKDNSSIPSGTLASLHQALGPSVILSYSARTGVVVFYDPINQVTVTETDLYEDYGYAEFNGDDYTASGCAP